MLQEIAAVSRDRPLATRCGLIEGDRRFSVRRVEKGKKNRKKERERERNDQNNIKKFWGFYVSSPLSREHIKNEATELMDFLLLLVFFLCRKLTR